MSMDFKTKNKVGVEWGPFYHKFVDQYASVVGVYGIGIYLVICRYINNKTEKSFPSKKRIASILGISERTVGNYLKVLVRLNFIKIEKERTLSGKFLHNTYKVIDRSEWVSPWARKGKTHGNVMPNKNTNNKKTNNYSNSNKLIPVKEFSPKTREEYLCKEIALEAGYKDINLILSFFKKYGLGVIEEARGRYKEQSIRTGAYFTGILKNVVQEKYRDN